MEKPSFNGVVLVRTRNTPLQPNERKGISSRSCPTSEVSGEWAGYGEMASKDERAALLHSDAAAAPQRGGRSLRVVVTVALVCTVSFFCFSFCSDLPNLIFFRHVRSSLSLPQSPSLTRVLNFPPCPSPHLTPCNTPAGVDCGGGISRVDGLERGRRRGRGADVGDRPSQPWRELGGASSVESG